MPAITAPSSDGQLFLVAEVVATSGSGQSATSNITPPVGQRYRGYSLRETSGSAACVVELYDNTAASGTLVDEIQIPAGTVSHISLVDSEGLSTGLFYHIVSGACKGVIRYG